MTFYFEQWCICFSLKIFLPHSPLPQSVSPFRQWNAIVTWSHGIFPTQKVLNEHFFLILLSRISATLSAVSVRKVRVLLFSTFPCNRKVLCFPRIFIFSSSSRIYCLASSSGRHRFPGHFLLDSNELRTKETVAAMCFAVLFVFHWQILPHAWVGQIDQPRKWKILE